MKKLLIVLLALTMVFAFAACGEQAETAADTETFSDTISIGDGVEDIDISGAPYGTYVLIDPLDEEGLAEGEDVVTYYDPECDTPYIEVFSIAKNGRTLAEFTQESAETWGNGYYQMMENFGFYTCSWEKVGEYYYVAEAIFEGDEKFHSVVFSAKTEEVALGDSGQYLWIPTGYTDVIDDDCTAHGGIINVEYAEEYYLPNIWVGKYDDSYAYQEWVWGFEYPDGIPVDEETYNGWVKEAEKDGWTDELSKSYYEAFGCTLEKSFVSEPADGVTVYSYKTIRNENNVADIYFDIEDESYNVVLDSTDIFSFYYAKVLIDSLHIK